MIDAALSTDLRSEWESLEEAVLYRTLELCKRRVLWLDHLAETIVNDESLHATHNRILANIDSPEAEEKFLNTHPQARACLANAGAVEQWLFEAVDNRFARLCHVLDLNHKEQRLLQLCFAFHIDPSLGHVFGNLNGSSGAAYPTEILAARLNGYGRGAMWNLSSAIGRWGVIQESEPTGGLQLDPYILSYLRGSSELDADLLNCCSVVNDVHSPLEDWPVNEVVQHIIEALQSGIPVRTQIYGAPLSGRKSFASIVCDKLGRTLIVVDSARVNPAKWDQTRMLVQRQALLHDAGVAWAGENAQQGLSPAPRDLDLEFIILDSINEVTPAIGWHDERVKIGSVSSAERRALWQQFITHAKTWPPHQLDHLSERYRLTIGEIAHIATQGFTEYDEIQQATRELSRGRLGTLANLLECPFTREDLCFPDEMSGFLDEFIFEAKHRNAFWENPKAHRLFPRGVGLIGLLAGPPGTGKTMAAQVIAEELGMDLYRIDLATAVDKYIGETAKHLRRLFDRAGEMNAVMLFDEADSLFSRRTDTKDSLDRHANSDTNYLLQLVEDYPGVYIPRPEAPERASIWHYVVAALTSPDCAARLKDDLQNLAHETPISGAQIKNAVLAAVFLAQQEKSALSAEHLSRALSRQLGSHNVGASSPTRQHRL